MAKVSVIIPTVKAREGLLKELLRTLPDDCEVIIMDDRDMALSTKRNKGGWSAQGDYLLFIDDDNYIEEGAIKQLIQCKADIVGMIACYQDRPILIADGGSKRSYLTGFMRGINTNKCIFNINSDAYEVDEVANAFMVKRNVFHRLGGFDDHMFPIDLDEADFCYRAKKAGYRIVIEPQAVCYHKSITYSMIPDFRRPKNAYYMGRNRILFQKKHLSDKRYQIYLYIFMPVFVLSYCLCLMGRRKYWMVYHFMKGVIDGLHGRIKNRYQ